MMTATKVEAPVRHSRMIEGIDGPEGPQLELVHYTCPVCNYRSGFIDEARNLEDVEGHIVAYHHPEMFKFAIELLVTDTVAHDIVKVNAASVVLRRRAHGETVSNDHRDGNPYPVTTSATEPTTAPTILVRRRKDGTYRIGLRAIRFSNNSNVVTDYRM